MVTDESEASNKTNKKMSKREKLIQLLDATNERLRREIGAMLAEISECLNLDYNLKQLPKLVNAKNAAGAILRAVKKNDFMMLKSDACNEIDALKHEAAQITQFTAYI